MTQIVPAILSGRSGTRLWPLSTDQSPPQFLALAPDQTTFADTLARQCNATRFAAPLIIGARRHASLMEAELGEATQDAAHTILEPSAGNTAPAIALAAIAAGSDDAAMLVMPSDHVIRNPHAFLSAVDIALPAASDGWLVTFGIEPTRPQTRFGYIRMARAWTARPACARSNASSRSRRGTRPKRCWPKAAMPGTQASS